MFLKCHFKLRIDITLHGLTVFIVLYRPNDDCEHVILGPYEAWCHHEMPMKRHLAAFYELNDEITTCTVQSRPPRSVFFLPRSLLVRGTIQSTSKILLSVRSSWPSWKHYIIEPERIFAVKTASGNYLSYLSLQFVYSDEISYMANWQ